MQLTALTALFALSVSAADYIPKILTGVIQSDDWTVSGEEGFYQLEAIPGGKLTRLSTERDIYAAPLGGAVYEDGKMHGIHYRAMDDPIDGERFYAYSVSYDLKTLQREKAQYLGDMYMNLVSTAGMTHDPVTGKNFGFFINPDYNFNVLSRNFASIDFVSKSTPQKSKIAEFDKSELFAAMAAGEDGRLYVVDHDGYLYTMNKNSGSTTLLGDLGVQDISSYPSSMTFDPRTKKLYWSYVDGSMKSYLYEINYTIGSVSATKIMQLPGNAILVNMYIAAPEASDLAPAAVTDLMASFEGEAYTGTVSFTLPVVTYDGSEDLTENLSYAVYANDVKVATGSAAPGSKVTEQVTVPESVAGDVTFKVVSANENGESPAEELELFVGLDTPSAVPAVNFTFDSTSHSALVTWSAPTTGLHGLTLTPANLAYNVVRYPGGTAVGSALKDCSFSEPLDDTQPLRSYYYVVTPVNGGKYTGESTSSNKTVVGVSLNPPYSEYFTTDAGFDIFTVIDANEDGAKWQRYHQVYQYSGTVADYARMDADRNNPDDDWLLLPPMNLRRGAVYELAFAAKKEYSGSNYNQRFEVKYGTGLDPETYTTLIANGSAVDVNFADFSKEFAVDVDGVYYIGFHALSNAGSGPLDLDFVSVKMLASPDAPAAVTDLEIVADPSGELLAIASMVAPSQNLHGDDLESLTKIGVTDAAGRSVGTVDNPKPGSKVVIPLSGITNGNNTFTVTPYVGSEAGHSVKVDLFVGEDIPGAPNDVKLYDDGEFAILTWVAPQVGVNGQYVNPDKMKFNLGDIDDVYGYFIPLVNDIKSPYNTGVKTAEGPQTLLYYALRGETRAGNGEPVATNGLAVGAPYSFPFKMSFNEPDWGSEPFVWYEGERADWNMGRTSDISSDGDGKAFIFTPNMAEYGIFNLPKISLAGAKKPALTFDYYVFPLAATSIAVAVDTYPQGQAETLQSYLYYNKSDEGWQTAEIDLSKYIDEPFVIVKFAMTSSSTYAPAVIDNVRIDESTTGVEDVTVDTTSAPYTVFTVDGRLVVRDAETLEGLAPGLYIVNGMKHYVK